MTDTNKVDVEPFCYCYVSNQTSVDVLTFDPEQTDAVDGTLFGLVPASALAALQTQLAEAQADAARYRWLRDASETELRAAGFDGVDGLPSGKELDAAIDAAMKEQA